MIDAKELGRLAGAVVTAERNVTVAGDVWGVRIPRDSQGSNRILIVSSDSRSDNWLTYNIQRALLKAQAEIADSISAIADDELTEARAALAAFLAVGVGA